MRNFEKDFGMSVNVKDFHGNVEKALRRFKKKINRTGMIKDVRDREHYVKPTVKRQRAKQLAVVRERKRQNSLNPHK